MPLRRLRADISTLSVRPRREDLEHLIRHSATGSVISIVITLLVLLSIWPNVGGPVLGLWALYTLGLNGWVLFRSARGAGHVRRVTARSLLKLRVFAVLMALPWSVLTLLSFSVWRSHELVWVLSSFCSVGMAAGGAFMLYRVIWSALLYLLTVLGPVIVSALFFADLQSGWAIAAFALVYCIFLSDFAINFARLDWSRGEALDALTSTVQKLEHANARISELAYSDIVTTLPNRKAFQIRLEEELRSSTAGFALLLMDLDRFKNVNDTLGHLAGDNLLAAVGQRLEEICTAPDMVARLSGDEFAIICHATRADLPALLHQIAERISAPFSINGVSIHSGISAGAAWFPDDADDGEKLMSLADLALREAKTDGLSHFRIFSPAMWQTFEEANHLADELRVALKAGALTVQYQPKFRLDNGAKWGAEALVRWRHPQLGFVPPAHFLPIAAERGLMPEVTAAIFDQVLRDLVAWRDAGVTVGPIAVNLHPNDLKSPDILLGHLEHAIGLGFGPEHLVLEITEGCFSERSPEAAIALLRRIADMGFELSLDDFGTGYAALSHLRTLPVSEIKIDRSFVSEINLSERDRAIVAATLAIAKAARLRTVVEGVETLEQLQTLQALGADFGQGFFWTRAVSPAELTDMSKAAMSPMS